MVVYFTIEIRIFRTTPFFFIHPVVRSYFCTCGTIPVVCANLIIISPHTIASSLTKSLFSPGSQQNNFPSYKILWSKMEKSGQLFCLFNHV
jgi:hypothetical protein